MRNWILLVLSFLVSSLSFVAHAEGVWLTAKVDQVRLLTPGLIVESSEAIPSIESVPCATSQRRIFLTNTDPQFDRKLSMAMSAQAQGKSITFYVQDPANDCQTVSAHGSLAIPMEYYWFLRD